MRKLALLFAGLVLVFSVTPSLKLVADDQAGFKAMKLMAEGKTEEAISIFEKLAEKGDDKAMVQLGIFYYEGPEGIKQDYAKAMDWWIKALRLNPDAYVNLGVMHRDGNDVPKNKKIAYCVFVSTHMLGIGTESTQTRANGCLRKILPELSKEEIQDCLTNYTMDYVLAYLEAKGKMEGVPDQFKPSADRPALKDTGWWSDQELDEIYGPPSEEERKRRKERDERIAAERKTLYRTIVYQFRFPSGTESSFKSYETVDQIGMSKGTFTLAKTIEEGNFIIRELSGSIGPSAVRFINLENEKQGALVFKIDHPSKPVLTDWSKWQKAEFVLKDSAETFFLGRGGDLPSKSNKLPENAPEFRFKVIEEPEQPKPPEKPKP